MFFLFEAQMVRLTTLFRRLLPNVVKFNVENGNVDSMLPDVVHNNVEIDNLGLTLLDVANFNVEIQIVFSTLI